MNNPHTITILVKNIPQKASLSQTADISGQYIQDQNDLHSYCQHQNILFGGLNDLLTMLCNTGKTTRAMRIWRYSVFLFYYI